MIAPWSRRAFLQLVQLACLTSACSSGKSSNQPLRAGLAIWVGYAPFYAAASKHIYDPKRIELKTLTTYNDQIRAFREGHVEILGLNFFDALRMRDEGLPVKIFMATDYSLGADGVVAREGIAGLRDLKGKRVSAEIGSLNHFVLVKALSRVGLSDSDVVLVNLATEAAVDALAKGEVDAVTLWEPHLSKAAAVGKARALFTSAEIPGEILDVMVVHTDAVEKRADQLFHFVDGWDEALKAWRERPQDVEAIMAQSMATSVEELKMNLKSVELLDRARNRALFDSASAQSMAKAYEAAVQFMNQHRLLKGPTPPAPPLEARFLASNAAK